MHFLSVGSRSPFSWEVGTLGRMGGGGTDLCRPRLAPLLLWGVLPGVRPQPHQAALELAPNPKGTFFLVVIQRLLPVTAF